MPGKRDRPPKPGIPLDGGGIAVPSPCSGEWLSREHSGEELRRGSQVEAEHPRRARISRRSPGGPHSLPALPSTPPGESREKARDPPTKPAGEPIDFVDELDENPELLPGAVVNVQWMFTDPLDSTGFGHGLTDAVEFVITP